MANKQASADHLLTTFPAPDDIGGWVDIWCRDDTGNIDCVPECMRHLVAHLVTPEGWLQVPMMPDTPYKIARWFQQDKQERPPWTGSGLSPYEVRRQWEEILREREAAAVVPEPEWSDLYFIGSESGPIKIGVSVDPAKRLKGLQTGYPEKLSLLAVIRGQAYREPEYHDRFAAHRLHGEWFSPAPEILAEITRLQEERV